MCQVVFIVPGRTESPYETAVYDTSINTKLKRDGNKHHHNIQRRKTTHTVAVHHKIQNTFYCYSTVGSYYSWIVVLYRALHPPPAQPGSVHSYFTASTNHPTLFISVYRHRPNHRPTHPIASKIKWPPRKLRQRRNQNPLLPSLRELRICIVSHFFCNVAIKNEMKPHYSKVRAASLATLPCGLYAIMVHTWQFLPHSAPQQPLDPSIRGQHRCETPSREA